MRNRRLGGPAFGAFLKHPLCSRAAGGSTLRDYQCDVIVLFVRTELPDFVGNGRQQNLAGQLPVLAQPFGEIPLSKFFPGVVTSFGYAIGVEGQDVPRKQVAFADGAIPLLEQAQRRAG